MRSSVKMYLMYGLLMAISGKYGLSLRAFSFGSSEQTDADVGAFVSSCMGQMSDADLGCPCARIGGQCQDTLSICDQSHHCKCDGSKGYLAASGAVCLPYPTTATTTTTATPTTTACPTCPAVTCPTTTTTTIAPATTIAAPAQTCTRAAGYVQYGSGEGGRRTTECPSACVSVTDKSTYTCPDVSYGPVVEDQQIFLRAFACPVSIFAPAGKTLKIQIDSINVPTESDCNDNAIIIDKAPGYCNANRPEGGFSPVSISSNVATIMLQLTNEGDADGDAVFDCVITITAV